jgi:hypothetical protein
VTGMFSEVRVFLSADVYRLFLAMVDLAMAAT